MIRHAKELALIAVALAMAGGCLWLVYRAFCDLGFVWGSALVLFVFPIPLLIIVQGLLWLLGAGARQMLKPKPVWPHRRPRG